MHGGTIRVDGIEEPIEGWRVVFATTEGIFETLNEARETCERSGDFQIVPLAVAYSANLFHIVLTGEIRESGTGPTADSIVDLLRSGLERSAEGDQDTGVSGLGCDSRQEPSTN